MKPLFIIFSSLIILNGCKQSKRQLDIFNLEYTYLIQDATVNPRIQGLWKSIGNGYILDARQDSVLLYSYTENFCYKEKNDYLERLLNSESQFSGLRDTISIFLTDFGPKTKTLQAKKDFVRLEALPKDCMSFDEMNGLNSRQLFDIWLETMKENYAFRKERSLNWDSIGLNYGKRIDEQATSKELFQLIGDIAILTKDHHTKIIAEDGSRLQYTGIPTAKLVVDSFNNQSEIDNLNQFFDSFFSHNYKNISDTLLHGEGEKLINNKIEWGKLNEEIGYINIHSFTGFGKDMTRKQQIDTINSYMEKIVGSLEETEAIIVDISFNFGGFDASGLTIAGYFTEETVHAYTSQVFNNGEFYNESEVTVIPAESINYTKPVYVLMTDISRSAAESFAMMMGQLPNVKLVGTNTLGILSGMLGKSIGPYYSTSSNQRLLTPEGKFYEVSGVEPDVRLDVFEAENVFDGHKLAVRDLIRIIQGNKPATNNR